MTESACFLSLVRFLCRRVGFSRDCWVSCALDAPLPPHLPPAICYLVYVLCCYAPFRLALSPCVWFVLHCPHNLGHCRPRPTDGMKHLKPLQPHTRSCWSANTVGVGASKTSCAERKSSGHICGRVLLSMGLPCSDKHPLQPIGHLLRQAAFDLRQPEDDAAARSRQAGPQACCQGCRQACCQGRARPPRSCARPPCSCAQAGAPRGSRPRGSCRARCSGPSSCARKVRCSLGSSLRACER